MKVVPANYTVKSAGELAPPPKWTLNPSRTCLWTDFDLWFLKSGRGKVQTPKGMFNLIPGSCLIMRGGEPYTFYPSFEKPFLHYWLHFDCLDDKNKVIEINNARVSGVFRELRKFTLIEQILDRCVKAFKASRQYEADAWLKTVIIEIYNREHDSKQQQLTLQERRIMDLCQAIDQAPEKNWKIPELCKKFCASRSNLYRAFIKYKKLSPQQYILDAKMNLARALLTESTNDINWVADSLGYNDVFFFSRQFKRFHNSCPTAYRKESQRMREVIDQSANS